MSDLISIVSKDHHFVSQTTNRNKFIGGLLVPKIAFVIAKTTVQVWANNTVLFQNRYIAGLVEFHRLMLSSFLQISGNHLVTNVPLNSLSHLVSGIRQ